MLGRSFVLDASVAAALYVDDPVSADAHALLSRLSTEGAELHAPDLLVLEVANVLWKRTRRSEIAPADALTAVNDLASSADLRLHSAPPLVRQALGVALAHGLTVYDAVYVALAALLGAVVLTADSRLLGTATAGLPVAAVTEV